MPDTAVLAIDRRKRRKVRVSLTTITSLNHIFAGHMPIRIKNTSPITWVPKKNRHLHSRTHKPAFSIPVMKPNSVQREAVHSQAALKDRRTRQRRQDISKVQASLTIPSTPPETVVAILRIGGTNVPTRTSARAFVDENPFKLTRMNIVITVYAKTLGII